MWDRARQKEETMPMLHGQGDSRSLEGDRATAEQGRRDEVRMGEVEGSSY